MEAQGESIASTHTTLRPYRLRELTASLHDVKLFNIKQTGEKKQEINKDTRVHCLEEIRFIFFVFYISIFKTKELTVVYFFFNQVKGEKTSRAHTGGGQA